MSGPRAACNMLRRSVERPWAVTETAAGSMPETASRQAPAPSRRRLPEPRSLLAQILIAASIVAVIWFLVHNTLENLRDRGVTTGFAFLWHVTSLPIADTWLD